MCTGLCLPPRIRVQFLLDFTPTILCLEGSFAELFVVLVFVWSCRASGILLPSSATVIANSSAHTSGSDSPIGLRSISNASLISCQSKKAGTEPASPLYCGRKSSGQRYIYPDFSRSHHSSFTSPTQKTFSWQNRPRTNHLANFSNGFSCRTSNLPSPQHHTYR